MPWVFVYSLVPHSTRARQRRFNPGSLTTYQSLTDAVFRDGLHRDLGVRSAVVVIVHPHEARLDAPLGESGVVVTVWHGLNTEFLNVPAYIRWGPEPDGLEAINLDLLMWVFETRLMITSNRRAEPRARNPGEPTGCEFRFRSFPRRIFS